MDKTTQKKTRELIALHEKRRRQLQPKLEELRELQQEYSRLECTIETLKASLGERVADFSSIEREAGLIPGLDPDAPIWQSAQALLVEKGEPMTAAEMAGELIRAGCNLQQTTAQDVIRQSMRRKPEVFKRVSRGRYGLATWEKE